MVETKELTCIVCPLGCHITVTLDKGKVVNIKGYSCPYSAKSSIIIGNSFLILMPLRYHSSIGTPGYTEKYSNLELEVHHDAPPKKFLIKLNILKNYKLNI